MAGTDVDSIRVFHIVSIQRVGDVDRRAFYSCAGKKQDRIWLTRPPAVKIVLFALALIPLLYLSEMRYTLTTSVLLTPYIIALLMLAPTLVRWLVKALKRF